MSQIDYVSAFKKYIDSIILPKYPEIQNFDVELDKSQEWDFRKAKWKDIVEMTFRVDGSEESFENSLRDDLHTMKTIFGLKDEATIHFRIVVNDLWNGDWYV